MTGLHMLRNALLLYPNNEAASRPRGSSGAWVDEANLRKRLPDDTNLSVSSSERNENDWQLVAPLHSRYQHSDAMEEAHHNVVHLSEKVIELRTKVDTQRYAYKALREQYARCAIGLTQALVSPASDDTSALASKKRIKKKNRLLITTDDLRKSEESTTWLENELATLEVDLRKAEKQLHDLHSALFVERVDNSTKRADSKLSTGSQERNNPIMSLSSSPAPSSVFSAPPPKESKNISHQLESGMSVIRIIKSKLNDLDSDHKYEKVHMGYSLLSLYGAVSDEQKQSVVGADTEGTQAKQARISEIIQELGPSLGPQQRASGIGEADSDLSADNSQYKLTRPLLDFVDNELDQFETDHEADRIELVEELRTTQRNVRILETLQKHEKLDGHQHTGPHVLNQSVRACRRGHIENELWHYHIGTGYVSEAQRLRYWITGLPTKAWRYTIPDLKVDIDSDKNRGRREGPQPHGPGYNRSKSLISVRADKVEAPQEDTLLNGGVEDVDPGTETAENSDFSVARLPPSWLGEAPDSTRWHRDRRYSDPVLLSKGLTEYLAESRLQSLRESCFEEKQREREDSNKANTMG